MTEFIRALKIDSKITTSNIITNDDLLEQKSNFDYHSTLEVALHLGKKYTGLGSSSSSSRKLEMWIGPCLSPHTFSSLQICSHQ